MFVQLPVTRQFTVHEDNDLVNAAVFLGSTNNQVLGIEKRERGCYRQKK